MPLKEVKQMSGNKEVSVEMQEVGAYPTKQKMNQKDVPLLDEKRANKAQTQSRNKP